MNVYNYLSRAYSEISSFLPDQEGIRQGASAAIDFLSGIPSERIARVVGTVAAAGAAYWAGKKISNRGQKKSDFIRRIPENDWKAILTKIKTLNHTVTEQELRAFQNGNWDHPIFQDGNWSYFAFSAFLAGKIDQETMCKLFLYNACQEHAARHGSRFFTYQLFDENGRQDPVALDCLRKATASYLGVEDFRLLIEELEKSPPHRTQFFAIERNDQDTLFKASIDSEKDHSLNLNLLTVREQIINPSSGKRKVMPWQIVAPPEFVYQIHRSRFGENAIRPAPALSYFRIEKFSDPTQRVACIPAFNLLPTCLHEAICEPLTVYHHDIAHHHAIDSANMHRPVWIAFAKFLKEKGMKWLVPKVFDREFTNYLMERRGEDSENFWMGLATLYRGVIRDRLSMEQRKEFQEKCLPLTVAFYRKHAAHLDEQYGLNEESLEGLLDQIKDTHHFETLSHLYSALIS